MTIKKLIEQYTPEEIAESMVLPVNSSAVQQKKGDKQLADARKKSQSELTVEQKLYAGLLQLRFQLEDYLNGKGYRAEFTFGYFLNRYLTLIDRKRKDFASEIQIHETLLSHLINDRREPSNQIIIRLELHSNNHLPAILWFKLIERKKEHLINTDTAMRKTEIRYVSGKLPAFA